MIWQILFGLALALAFLAIWRVGCVRVKWIEAERESTAWYDAWTAERIDNVVLRDTVAELKAKIAPFDRDGDGSPGGSVMVVSNPDRGMDWLNHRNAQLRGKPTGQVGWGAGFSPPDLANDPSPSASFDVVG